ncbi:MAG: N-acetyl-gamma-glutamyl-phosphate reductase [Candidatus Margulisbacteria bacterium]|jgi:N-acetyl-gamma-glutamyl-phosphate reductase|nr:N-acetyl-gamma-glutamyl-phosphate reductase [Candidatus Margulisiibacteriota bacterium]
MSGKIKIGIIGATGYTGAELLRLLLDHPQADLKYLTTTSAAGQDISEIYPFLRPRFSQKLAGYELSAAQKLDVVFICLPHGKSMDIAPELVNAGVKVIDLGADFRFRDLAVYEKTYQKHTAPEMNAQAVYGLPEYNRAQIQKAKLIANPGCYVTAATLALKPIIENLSFVEGSIIIDAKSGVSGAGRALRQDTHFLEVYTNFSAYKLGVHRHQPEIEQNLGGAPVVFSPHLLPVNRGILATIYVKLGKKTDIDNILSILQKQYQNEPFVRVVKNPPALKDVVGSNYCLISPTVVSTPFNDQTQLILVSALDNLVKGASGQAVQNMNIMFGLPETTGLERVALNP